MQGGAKAVGSARGIRGCSEWRFRCNERSQSLPLSPVQLPSRLQRQYQLVRSSWVNAAHDRSHTLPFPTRSIMSTTSRHLSFLAVALLGSLTASAEEIKRVPLTASQNPTNAELPFSAAVWAGDTLYVSGWLDPDIKSHPDTTSQTVSLLKDVQRFLVSQSLTLGDVVMMRVYLGGDPANDGKMDLL